MAERKKVLELAGHEVAVSNPSKVYFPRAGVTKLDLVRYYLAVAGPLMAAMGGRPVLLQRFPHGAGGSRCQLRASRGERAYEAFTPHWFAFHGMPIELVFGTMFTYLVDHP